MTEKRFYILYSIGVGALALTAWCYYNTADRATKELSAFMRGAANDFPKVVSDVKEIKIQMELFNDRFDEMSARLERLERKM